MPIKLKCISISCVLWLAAKRIDELNDLIKKLYEGNATGKIPDRHFTRLLADYDSELAKPHTSRMETAIRLSTADTFTLWAVHCLCIFTRLLADYDSELSTLEARTEELDNIIAQGTLPVYVAVVAAGIKIVAVVDFSVRPVL